MIPRLALKPELVYRLFYPQVPTILCAKSKLVSAMPVASAIQVSNFPSRIAVSIRKSLNTSSVLRKADSFSLNWLDYKDRNLIRELSTFRAKKNRDKLQSLKIPYRMVLGAPVLDNSLAYVILEKERMIDVGDHNLFIGHVVGAMASLDFDEYWKFKKYKPVLYLGSPHKRTFSTL